VLANARGAAGDEDDLVLKSHGMKRVEPSIMASPGRRSRPHPLES
jgi:hypothetical protein